MSSTKEFKDFILDQLRELDSVACRAMMGEFVLYYCGIIFGGIYDDRFLVKKAKCLESLNLIEQIPYPGAKPMLLMDSENPCEIKEIVEKNERKEE